MDAKEAITVGNRGWYVSYIPADAKWYVAELVSETKVEDDQRNVVHRDFVLVEASSPEEAYEKSLQLGRENNATFENPEGKVVRITFRGIAELGVIGAELKHGTEILFKEQIGVPENRIQQLIAPKERLGVFCPIEPSAGPNYASRDVLKEVDTILKNQE